jgi:hypothetical protein
MEPFPSIAKTFAIVQQELKLNPNGKILSSSAQPIVSATSWKPGSTNLGKGRGKLQNNCGSSSTSKICSFYGKENQTVDTC